MELPSICFVFPYIFMAFFIIIHIVIFLLIIKFVQNVEKLPFLWGMINWTIAIGIIFCVIGSFIEFNTWSLQLLRCFIGGTIPPITEDVGRLIVFLFIYKSKNHNFNNSLMFGAGHGGWESIVLLSINQIKNLIIFNEIKNAKNEKELEENGLDEIYDKYKNGVPGDEIFGFIIRFGGNLFHIGATIIAYRLSLNRKEKKYIIYFIILFIIHFITDTFGQFSALYKLNFWFNLIGIGLDIVIIVISWLVWKENNNKEYSDYNFENNETIIALGNIEDKDN